MSYSPGRFSRKHVKVTEEVRVPQDDQMPVAGLIVDGNLIVDGDVLDLTQASPLPFQGPVVTNADSPYMAQYNETVKVDPSGGAVTIVLPTPIGVEGQRVNVKNVTTDTTPITVQSVGAETLDGQPNQILTVAYERLIVESDGANYMVMT